jgi:hypothetical protein
VFGSGPGLAVEAAAPCGVAVAVGVDHSRPAATRARRRLAPLKGTAVRVEWESWWQSEQQKSKLSRVDGLGQVFEFDPETQMLTPVDRHAIVLDKHDTAFDARSVPRDIPEIIRFVFS